MYEGGFVGRTTFVKKYVRTAQGQGQAAMLRFSLDPKLLTWAISRI